jgi:hypothetical protein
MTFSHAVDRLRAHFTEMPGLELTIAQAVRLVGFGVDDCRYVVDSLVDAGFLKWTARRTIVRTGSGWSQELEQSYRELTMPFRLSVNASGWSPKVKSIDDMYCFSLWKCRYMTSRPSASNARPCFHSKRQSRSSMISAF